MYIYLFFPQQPKVLVVDASRVGIQIARNGRNIELEKTSLDEISGKDLTVQTIFEKDFSTSIKLQTSQDIKSEVILGALRNVLLVCEICKVPPLKPVKTTERPCKSCKYLNTVDTTTFMVIQ